MNTTLHTMLLAGLLTVLPAWAASPPAKPATIPFDLEEGNIVVQVELTPGRPLPFIFDSGLSHGNIVSADAARTLHLKITGEVNLNDASGTPNAAKLTTIPNVRVGGAVLRDQAYAIIDIPDEVTERGDGEAPIAGFLGAPLMQDAVVCVDYQNEDDAALEACRL